MKLPREGGMVEPKARRRLLTAAVVATLMAVGVTTWLLAPRGALATGGSEDGYVAAVAVMLYLVLATRRDDLTPTVRRALIVVVGVAALAGVAVFALAR